MCEHHAEAGYGNVLKIYGWEPMAATISGEMPTITARKIKGERLCSPTSTYQSHSNIKGREKEKKGVKCRRSRQKTNSKKRD